MEKYKEKENRLKLIPKAENYCTYIINVIINYQEQKNLVQEQNIKKAYIK